MRTAGVLVILTAITYLLGPALAAIGLTVGGVWVVSKGGEASTMAAVGAGIWVFVILVTALFVWLATKLRQGRGWARSVVTVLFVLGVVGSVAEAVTGLTADPVVLPLVGVVRVALMAAALFLLWRPEESRAYFESAPR